MKRFLCLSPIVALIFGLTAVQANAGLDCSQLYKSQNSPLVNPYIIQTTREIYDSVMATSIKMTEETGQKDPEYSPNGENYFQELAIEFKVHSNSDFVEKISMKITDPSITPIPKKNLEKTLTQPITLQELQCSHLGIMITNQTQGQKTMRLIGIREIFDIGRIKK